MYERINLKDNNIDLRELTKEYFDELMLMVNITYRYSFDSSFYVQDGSLNVVITVNSIEDRDMLIDVLKHNNQSYNTKFMIAYNHVEGFNINVTVSKTG